jgi:ABC-type antimicrobial peptide transport system permease subunit
MLLLAVLAGLALVLAAVGLYGVLAYFVGERTREIGVRRALGAPRGSVVKLVLGQGARLVGIGLVIGGVSAIWGTRFLRGLLYEIGTGDPGAIAGAVSSWAGRPGRRPPRPRGGWIRRSLRGA